MNDDSFTVPTDGTPDVMLTMDTTDELTTILRRCYHGKTISDACQGTSYADRVDWARYNLEWEYAPLRFDGYGGFELPLYLSPTPQQQARAETRFRRDIAGSRTGKAAYDAVKRYCVGRFGTMPPEPPNANCRRDKQVIFERIFVPRGWTIDCAGYAKSPHRRSAAQQRIDHIYARLYDPEHEPEALARVRDEFTSRVNDWLRGDAVG